MTRDEQLVDAIGEKVAASQDWIGGAHEAYDLVREALASGGSGEAPAGLTRGEARAAYNAMKKLRQLYPNSHSGEEFDSAEAKLFRRASPGEVVATESGGGNGDG